MTKLLITFLASVVGAFALVGAPVANAAMHEHYSEATASFTLVFADGLVGVTTSEERGNLLNIGPEDIAYLENTLEPMPTAQLPIGVPVTQTTSSSGWVIDGSVEARIDAHQRLQLLNSTSDFRVAQIFAQGKVSATYSDPYPGGPGDTEVHLRCYEELGGTLVALEVFATNEWPSSPEDFMAMWTIVVPPFGANAVWCLHMIWTTADFYTEESYDAAVTAFEVPDSVRVPPPRREGFAVEVMNQGLEPAAGQVTVHASAGKPDTFVLPFGQVDPLEPGERITLTPDTNWRPPVRDVTVAWDADANWGLDQYPDNDIMTAETEVVRVRP